MCIYIIYIYIYIYIYMCILYATPSFANEGCNPFCWLSLLGLLHLHTQSWRILAEVFVADIAGKIVWLMDFPILLNLDYHQIYWKFQITRGYHMLSLNRGASTACFCDFHWKAGLSGQFRRDGETQKPGNRVKQPRLSLLFYRIIPY